MSLQEKYGPVLTLKEVCTILKMKRTAYYSYIKNKEKTVNKDNTTWIPDPIPNFTHLKFRTSEIEQYLKVNGS